MKKVTGVIAAAAVFVVTLGVAGCGAVADGDVPQDEGTPDSLTMLVTASPSAEGLKALAIEYEDETGIAIEFVEVPYAQLATKVILAAQSGESTFDMAQVDGFQMPQVVAGGGLLGLDDYLKGDADYDYADFPDGLKAYAKQDGVSYGLPLSTEPYLQWYRTDLFDELGLEPAVTWDDVISNAKALEAAGDYGYMGIYAPTGSAHFFNAMLVGSGGRLLDPETFRPMLDSEVAKTTMERYLDLLQYGPSSAPSATSFDAVNAFSQLEVGQMTLASGWWSTVNDPSTSKVVGKVATAEPPTSDGGEYDPAAVLYGWVAGISRVSPHQQAAWDFLSWALSRENVQAFVDAGAPPPARISTTENPELLAQLPYLEAVGKSAETGVPIDRIPEMSQLITSLSQNINAMATDQLSFDDGMVKAQDDLMNILVQSGRYTG